MMNNNLLDDPWRLDAAVLARLIRFGKISCREAVQSSLDRLDQVNPALNAVVLRLGEEALAAADAADAALRRGDAIGPLHGVPVTTKINVDQRGCPTDNGVVANKSLMATEDNPVVANLRRAGAIIIGRTNAPAYSMRWFTDNALHGATYNPWSKAHTPGGSSGGAASAVAAGIGAIAQGNDIAGSVRYPAYCCGVTGLRPSMGRVPAYNSSVKTVRPISSQLMSVNGPLARRVADLRLGFAAMAVPDPRDARCVAMPLVGPPPPRPIRVALVVDPSRRGVAPAVAESVQRAGRYLAAAGYAVEEIEPPLLGEVTDLWPRIAKDDVLAMLDPLVQQYGDDGTREAFRLLLTAWPSFGPADCLKALAERDSILAEWEQFFLRYPIIVMPDSAEQAFLNDLDRVDVATTRRIIEAQRPQTAISVLGLPAVSVPIGVHEGLPLGVQVVAGRFREDLCFDAAEVIEAHSPMPTPIDPRS
jgi:amidase